MEQTFNLSKIKPDSRGRAGPLTLKRKKRDCSPVDMKMNGVYNYCVQSVNSISANLQPINTNRYEFIYRLVFIIDINR